MPFHSLRTFPGNTWPCLPPTESLPLWSLYQQLDRTQWLTPDEIKTGQLSQARRLLAHCLEHVPYYRSTYGKLGVVPDAIRTMADFRALPLLARRTYQERFPDIQATSLPDGMRVVSKSTTSGTTGQPLTVLHTNVTNLYWQALHLRDLEWGNIDPRGRLAGIRPISAPNVEPEAARRGLAMRNWGAWMDQLMETGPSFGMDISQEPQRQLDWLLDVKPNIVLSYPSNLELLAGLLEARDLKLPDLWMVQAIGESVEEHARQRIEKAFAARLHNLYSCSEAGYLASPCPDGLGSHVHAENVILEILDETGQPCPPGEPGRAIVTALHNFATPFIRYEIGDELILGECTCGRGLPLLQHVGGKLRPALVLPDGRTKSSAGLVQHLFKLGAHYQYQIVQEKPDRLLIRIVPAQDWNESHREQVRSIVRTFFETDITLDLEEMERIPTTRAGKVRDVICKLDGPACET